MSDTGRTDKNGGGSDCRLRPATAVTTAAASTDEEVNHEEVLEAEDQQGVPGQGTPVPALMRRRDVLAGMAPQHQSSQSNSRNVRAEAKLVSILSGDVSSTSAARDPSSDR